MDDIKLITGTTAYDFHFPKYYGIDFEKVRHMNDIIAILKSLNIQFSSDYKYFNEIKHLVKEIE